MKIACECGETIFDSTDHMSYKGHIIPDQDWFNVFDYMDDEIIDKLCDGTIDKESANMNMRSAISAPARLAWQCRSCGRIYIDGKDNKLECYVPSDEDTEKNILCSKSENDKT